MALIETEALVLKSYGLSEADKIIVLLTRDHGLVRGVAKGAKRLKSRFGSSLEPFSVIRVAYFQKDQQELVSIKGSELLQSFFDRASDPLFLQKFAYIAELLTEFAPPSDPNERLFKMARVCLETSVEGAEDLDQILLYFELWLLKLGGYLPSWDRCDECGTEFSQGEKASLQINFHLLCQRCARTRTSRIVEADEREIFRLAQKASPTRFIEETTGKRQLVRDLSGVLRRIIAGILGRDSHEERILAAIY